MTTELAVIEQSAVALAYQQQGGVKTLLEKLAEEVRKEVPDLTTKKGRDRIASLAHKVSKTKVMVDDHGKDLVAAEKARLALIDKDRREWRDGCDALRDEIRKPLTDWEQAEESRVQNHRNFIKALHDLGDGLINGQPQAFGLLFAEIELIVVDDRLQEFEAEAHRAKESAKKKLDAAFAEHKVREAELAELARLREEAAKREQEERDRRIAQEAADRARAEAEVKAGREKAEAEAKAKAEQEAIERQRIAAEQAEAKAKADAEAAEQRAKDEERRRIEAETRAKVEAEQALIRAEADKKAAIEAERQRIEAQRIADEKAAADAEAKRIANREHVRKVNRAALDAMLKAGISEEQGKALIKLIADGEVPRIAISY